MNNYIKKSISYVKEIIKRHDLVYILIFSIMGVWWIKRARNIFNRIKYPEDVHNNNKKILILAIRTIPTTNLVYFDSIFGIAFKLIGSDVKMLYCDGILKSCDADTVSRNQKAACILCRRYGEYVKNTHALDSISYGQYINENEIKIIEETVGNLTTDEMLNYKYYGVNVGAHAKSSVIRFFLIGYINIDDNQQIDKLREKLIYAMISTKVADGVYKKETPNLIFMTHGTYSTWAPFFEYFRNRNIEVIIYGNQPLRFGRFIFNKNGKEFDLVGKSTWDSIKTNPLTIEEEEAIELFFNQRIDGSAVDNLSLFENNYDVNIDKEVFLKKLTSEKFIFRYVMYPNQAWDACVDDMGSNAFLDIFSWIDSTVDFFKKRPEYQLIIKPHPAELIWEKSNKSISAYIHEKHQNLTDNIIILNPDAPIRAYDLFGKNMMGLTFNGTVALEAATKGIPFLVAGDSHYKAAGVVYELADSREYFDLIDNPQKIILFAQNNIKYAKRFAYYYFFRVLVRIPFYKEDSWAEMDWDVIADVEKLYNENSQLLKICKKIIQGNDIVEPL